MGVPENACRRVCVCLCVCVCVRTDPIVTVFVCGVESGFLRVDNVMRELFDGMYLNIVRVMLSLLLIDLILYAVIVKLIVLIAITALYKYPLLLLLLFEQIVNSTRH